MNLTNAERRWLPWMGSTGKLAMKKATWLNRGRSELLAETFESIAQTRVQILQAWVNSQWAFLENAALYLQTKKTQDKVDTLQHLISRGADFSELFLVDHKGKVSHSSAAILAETQCDSKALQQGLQDKFLHGPYVDPRTLSLGASSSSFHDAVTLMFYLPLFDSDKQVSGCLCGRVPNDVLGDLIQREAGHIYSESGDNYIFMVESNFDSSILPGTALSRSRFEDNTFSHGENLKSGVKTEWGTVKVQQHTEFEIRFTDPATGQLHPGVRETIANGSNLYVDYPGYSDYRHIPVIGKGVTFQMQGSADRWGMMCEADLEEVYRHRSLTYSLTRQYVLCMLMVLFAPLLANHWLEMGLVGQWGLSLSMALFSALAFKHFCASPVTQGLKGMTRVIQTIAEGDGNLNQRLDASQFKADETGDMGRWVNSFIDNLEELMGRLVQASNEVQQVSASMLRRCQKMDGATVETAESIDSMLNLATSQQDEIALASDSAHTMQAVMQQVVDSAQQEYFKALEGANTIREIVESSAKSVNDINKEMQEIGGIVKLITEITDQTNLLALNAAIEAARAGEHGRGFSVVADEVRNLADKTSQAANHIGELMNKLHRESETAVKFMQQGIENVDSSSVNNESSNRNEQLQKSVSSLFDIINDLSANSEKHKQTACGAQDITVRLQTSAQQMSRRTTLMENAIQRLELLVGRFDVSRIH
ncbi:methyl-accepting chemotaxis protein [Agarivorans sp. Z349TD_8]|uniref:methyl-accepting chemotaxis protein n=1 Tax=Agarivorans sp. Z349TD_8 TaxID=3421434 RepID=UPI003D7E89FD